MNRIGYIVTGILLIVAGMIIFGLKMPGEEIVLRIAGGSIMVAGLAFLVESTKKKNSNNKED